MVDHTVKREDIFHTNKRVNEERLVSEKPKKRNEHVCVSRRMDPPEVQPMHRGIERVIGFNDIDFRKTSQEQLRRGQRKTFSMELMLLMDPCETSNLLEFCKSENIVVVVYSALGSQRDPNCNENIRVNLYQVERDSSYLLDEPILSAIAKKHNRNSCQVAQHYQLQWSLVLLTKSSSEKRIKENFQGSRGWKVSPE
ncbi:hypothetical protein HPG69_008447 [Diceros bicornis minor]|uniref:NADP-dependent oxidoreductase domain-containing protein n=1 Tax=Diceros bicornis minor TaxID=77932 RepID=A0A7J7FKT1_DICBM|nr:hypothetical protein HPG69_008447 [Diceros bicornis minor]